jgi:hypothetical protein
MNPTITHMAVFRFILRLYLHKFQSLYTENFAQYININ